MKKVLLSVFFSLIFIIAGVIVYVNLSWRKDYGVPFPEISASTDSVLIARGRYLAYGPAHCVTCHVSMDKVLVADAGAELPLSGGWELIIPPGEFYGPNLTPDMETGIGKYSDAQLARALRHSIGHDGRVLIPVMPFQKLSDYDLTAIISFLRSQSPVRNEVKRSKYSLLGKALLTFGVLKPVQPIGEPALYVPNDTSANYGSYIANSVANCVGCHTNINLKTGEVIGIPFAGGFHVPVEKFSKGYSFVSPNITPDSETGIMASWSEEEFVNRFKKGRLYEGSPMPWGLYSRMDESELKSLYRYLHGLQPVHNKIDQIVFPPQGLDTK